MTDKIKLVKSIKINEKMNEKMNEKISDKQETQDIQQNLIQLKAKDVTKIRNNILREQNGCCALCIRGINATTGISLDHQHKNKKTDCNGIDGAGLVRGVLCRDCNVWEGKIWNNTKRYRQQKTVKDRIDMLKSLISYYEKGTYNYIHHTEKEQEPNVSKQNYNKLKKIYNGKKKFPEYPKSKKLTNALKELFNKYNIEPYNKSCNIK